MALEPKVFKAYDVRRDLSRRARRGRRVRIGRAYAEQFEPKRIAVGHDMRLSSPTMPRRSSRARRGRRRRRRHRDDRHRDALLRGRRARPRRRRHDHRLAQPEGVHGHEDRPPRRAAGRRRLRPARHPRPRPVRRRVPGDRPDVAGRVESATSTRASSTRSSRSSTRRSPSRSASSIDAANGMAGAMLPPDPRPAAHRRRPLLLRARRDLPQPRAQPAARGEPRVHRREGATRRAPTSGSPSTATPTAASSSTTPASSCPGTSSPRSSPSRCSRRSPAPRSSTTSARAGPSRTRSSGSAAPRREPRRPRLHQAPDARGGRRLRRRGLRPLLLPRLQPGRLRDDSRSARARARLEGGPKLSELLRPLRERYFLTGEINTPVADVALTLQRLKEHFGPAGRGPHLDGISITAADWHLNVRPSNTEPLLRLNLEALDPEWSDRKRDEALAVISGESPLPGAGG